MPVYSASLRSAAAALNAGYMFLGGQSNPSRILLEVFVSITNTTATTPVALGITANSPAWNPSGGTPVTATSADGQPHDSRYAAVGLSGLLNNPLAGGAFTTTPTAPTQFLRRAT